MRLPLPKLRNIVKRTTRRRLARLTFPLGIRRRHHRRANQDNRDAVLIWIPKTAGQSVTTLLQEHGSAKLKDPFAARHCFPQRGLVTFGHQSYPQLLAAGIVSQAFDHRAFKFCFVRNPYDRAVSLYCYLHKQGRIDASWSFRTFAERVADGACEPIGMFNWRGMSQCNPQVRWIHDEQGRSIVDYVGRFECIDNDMAEICDELGITGELPRRNVGGNKPYRDYYDDAIRRLIERAYAEDIETFGYEF